MAITPRLPLIPLWLRIGSLLLILMGGMAAVLPDPKAFHLAPCYPLGLIFWAEKYHLALEWVIIGYFFFAALPVAILFASRRSYFTIFTVMLVVTSAINVGGCRHALEGLSIDG